MTRCIRLAVALSASLLFACASDTTVSSSDAGVDTGRDSAGADTQGSGGRLGSGGTNGTGGKSGSGGVAGTGGVTGTGGVAGTGGIAGSGGKLGSGGAGSGGATGSGGTGAGGMGSGGKLGSGGSGSGGSGCTDTCPTTSTGFIQVGCAKRFVYGVNYAWANFGNDFGGYTTWGSQGVAAARATRKTEMQDMKNNGVDTIRWWMFPNFDRTDGIAWGSNGNPTGLAATTVADIQAALDIAAELGMHIQLTLFSFDSFKNEDTVNGAQVTRVKKLSNYLADATKRATIINNIVKPVAAAVAASANRDRLISWDVINEPEWAISGNDSYGDQNFDPQTDLTAVPFSQMETFVKEVIVALHAGSTAPVTVGGAAIKWAKAWSQVGVDYYTFHMYGWVNDSFPYDQPPSSFRATGKPINMGEFPLTGLPASTQGRAAVDYATFMNTIWSLGYAGAQGWSVTDSAFNWSGNKAKVKAFADAKGCMVRF